MSLAVDRETKYIQYCNDAAIRRVLTDADAPERGSVKGEFSSSVTSTQFMGRSTSIGSQMNSARTGYMVPRSPSPPQQLDKVRHLLLQYLPDQEELWGPETSLGASSSGSSLDDDLPFVYRSVSSRPFMDKGIPVSSPSSQQASPTKAPARAHSALGSIVRQPTNQVTTGGSVSTSQAQMPHHSERTAHYPAHGPRSTLPDPSLATTFSKLHLEHTITDGSAPWKKDTQSTLSAAPTLLASFTEDTSDMSRESSLQGVSSLASAETLVNFETDMTHHTLDVSTEAHGSGATHVSEAPGGAISFHRQPITEPTVRSSLLKQRLCGPDPSLSTSSLHEYSRIAAHGNVRSMNITIYFPGQSISTQNGANRSLSVSVQLDANMEELIGYALYLYTHTYGSLPSHPDIQDNLDLVTITQSWVLRMVEDGMVDYDYPAIEYNLTVGRFGEDEFALCPKTLPKLSIPSVPASSSGVKLSPSNEPTVSLTIMVVPTASGNTQIQVRPDTTTAEVLAAVCQQCHLEHPQNYALLRRDRGELIDMQLKAADFQHVDDLALVERTSMQAQALSNDLGPVLQQPKYKNAMDLITNYKSYAVNRRHHIAMGRQERILTLDGDWIHILRPTEKRLSHSKTTSYHVSSIMRCELNPRIPTQFRIVAYRERSRDTKRYEFETDDKDRAAEIVHEINHLLQQ